MTEQTAIEKPVKIQEYIRSKEIMQRFADLLGSNGAAGYVQSVLLTVSTSNDLMTCTPNSVISCALRAATMKLSCDPTTKQAYLVPFKKNTKNELGVWVETKIATLIVGYMGLYQMAIRTGKYRYINVYPIEEGVTVSQNPISGFHSISGGPTSKKIVGYLGAFEMTNGYGKTIYMTVDELIAHGQQYSKSYNDPKGKWQTAPHDMYKKTVMRMLLIHWGYLDPHDITMINQVDEAIDLEDALTVTPREPEENAAALDEVLAKEVKQEVDYYEREDEATPVPIPAIGSQEHIEWLRENWPEGAAVSFSVASMTKGTPKKKDDPAPLYFDLFDDDLNFRIKSLVEKLAKNDLTIEIKDNIKIKIDTARTILAVRNPQTK
jgi:recombination protein RecT